MAEELKILSAFFVVGISSGIIFDFFRIIRKLFKMPDFFIYIQDVLFWLLTGALTLMVNVIFAGGKIRLYMILTLIMGTIFYFVTISRYIFKIFFKK